MIKTVIKGKKNRVGDEPALIFFRGSMWSIYLSSTLPGQAPEAERFIPGIEQRLEAFVVSIGTGFPQYVRCLLHLSHNLK